VSKEAIIKNFSRCAYSYDRYADVQKLAALRLLEEIKDKSFQKILEIGCGTGNYTSLLRERFRKSTFKAIDISDKMVEVASKKLNGKGIEFVVADAEEIDLDDDFDLITSNACFQWFECLDRSLLKYKDALRRGGIILFSLFGTLTFWELGVSLRSLSKDVTLETTSFLTKERIEEVLNMKFRKVKITETRYREVVPNLYDLLRKIKYTGVRGGGLNHKAFLGPRLLQKLEECYLERFKKITATYQLFFCLGQK